MMSAKTGVTDWADVRGLTYDPWMHFCDAWEPCGWQLIEDKPATFYGEPVWGVTDYLDKTVALDYRLSASEARSTLTHELLHLQLGPITRAEFAVPREEHEIDKLVATRLVVFDELMNAAPSADSFEDLADLLNVDRLTILGALQLLTNHQHQQLLRFVNLHQVSTMEPAGLRRSPLRRRQRPGRHAIV